jgi:urease subunit gamma/beta
MRLLPRERDRLLIFQAAELARRRRGRGLALNQAEAVALITDEVLEAARDGKSYREAEQFGYSVLSQKDVMDGVPALVDSIQLEALFEEGMRLIVLNDPISRDAPADESAPDLPIDWLAGAPSLVLTNLGGVPVAVTAGVHIFEVNRELDFDRKAAWGMRLAAPVGSKLVIPPGEAREVKLMPIGGGRVIRGHGGLVDGRLDDEQVFARALGLAEKEGYRGI